ncbi:MAG: putative exonuclease [Prokaryotic dsDNA virus sp.]|nr:MAG: putative exonuclease [Prokaryotic dsDNA virus sp.]|tara:strand:- start:2353 stop:3273 length:921 start_codon:yes stop_codon:yes gene_type:complete
MPKYTITGKELGASECGAIVLGKTAFTTRDKILKNTKNAIKGIEVDKGNFSSARAEYGNRYEAVTGTWASDILGTKISFPDHAHRNEDLRMGASLDAIISNNTYVTVTCPITGKMHTFEGPEGIMEIKTDNNHRGVPKEEWIIQVHHQMICSGLEWGVIAVATQKMGEPIIYPVPKDAVLMDNIRKKVAEFWDLVDNDGTYPPLAPPSKESVDLTLLLKQTNTDMEMLCGDYLKQSAEARESKKLADEIRDNIEIAMQSMDIEFGHVGNYQIKCETVKKLKRKSVPTNEEYESISFSIKQTEIYDE